MEEIWEEEDLREEEIMRDWEEEVGGRGGRDLGGGRFERGRFKKRNRFRRGNLRGRREQTEIEFGHDVNYWSIMRVTIRSWSL